MPWMHFRMLRLFGIVLALSTLSVCQDAGHTSSCDQIRRACTSAGFVVGGGGAGTGLWKNCIEPILRGSSGRRVTNKNLPQIDPTVVAACKVEDPNFGPRKKQSGESGSVTPQTSTPSEMPPQAKPPGNAKGPNIVFVLTDDLAMNLVQFMPHVLKMQHEGITFNNYFVTDSLCCPSRSSIFTGRYPHNTGIFKNQGDDGGYIAFRDRGHERVTFATSIAATGYRTAMLGKYLNGYKPAQDPPSPGWTFWSVAGNAYRQFHYSLNNGGKVLEHGNNPADYLTDVLAQEAVQFIRDSGTQPFVIEVATFAPHAPYTPSPRDADAFPDLKAPRTPAFNAEFDANTPKWLRLHPRLTDADTAAIDQGFRKRAQSVLAIDAMIGELQAAVTAAGQEKNTYFVFSSDNGLHMGDYRLMPGKMTAYDTDVHVPLVITGPGVAVGAVVDEMVENVDLCPTFVELTGAVPPPSVDGASLVPFLHGQKTSNNRAAILIEHHGPRHESEDPDAPALRSGNPPSYEALRTNAELYVEYDNGETEFHDLVSDPYELRNTSSTLPGSRKAALHAALAAMERCQGTENCEKVQRPALADASETTR